MKKRYARILAATLSAAMVFTSAPVNFTGIDLGVIEAKAAGELNDTAIRGKFPVSPEAKFGSKSIETQAGVEAVANETDMLEVSKLSVGQSRNVTFTYSLGDNTFADGAVATLGAAGYDVNQTAKTVSKKIEVTVIAADASDIVTFPRSPYAKASYGSDVVSLYDDAGFATASNTWVVKEVKSTVKTTAANGSVTDGVTIESANTFVIPDGYSINTALSNAGLTGFKLNASNKLEGKINVGIVKAKVDPATIGWPAGLDQAYKVGADTTSAELASSTDDRFTFAVSLGAFSSASVDAGTYSVIMTATPTANYEIDTTKVDYSRESLTVGGGVTRNLPLVVTVPKNIIKIANVKNGIVNDKYDYGTTYDDLIQSKATGVTYTIPGVDRLDVVPVGTHNINVRATANNAPGKSNNCFDDGDTSVDIPVTFEIKKPEVSAKVGKQVTNAAITTATLESTKYIIDNTTCKYQWYSVSGTNKVALTSSGAKGDATPSGTAFTAPSFTPSAVGTYVCEFTLDSTDANVKATLETLTYTTPNVQYVKSSDVTSGVGVTVDVVDSTGVSASDAQYDSYDGYSFEITPTVANSYAKDSIKAYYLDEKGTKTDLTLATVSGKLYAAVPKKLNAGKYTFVAEMVAKKASSPDVEVANAAAFEVKKKEISASDIRTTAGKYVNFEKTSYPYKTAVSDIKFTNAKADLFGEFKLSKNSVKTIAVGTNTITLDYVISDEYAKNYDAKNVQGVTQTVTGVARKIKVVANDITINKGDALPTLTGKEYTFEGQAEDDDVAAMLSKVEITYSAKAASDAKVVGTYANDVRISTSLRTAFSTNYEVLAVDGKLIVKDPSAATPSDKPSVTPTPAPAEKAPAAKKVTNSVKRGKQVALKLSNAKGAKVTWRVESKAKKALKVSKKGKVTVLKTAKKGKTYKVFAYVTKNGKKTKVTFKIKVK